MKKRIFALAFAVVFGFVSQAFAQADERRAVLHFPQHTEGFMVLNGQEYPEVSTWLVNVLRRQITADGFVDETVERYRLNGNFLTVPAEYWHTTQSDDWGYTLQIIGYSVQGNEVLNEIPFVYTGPPANVETLCIKSCNGISYAYTINLYNIAGSNGTGKYMEIVRMVNFINEQNGVVVPVYQYMYQPQFQQIMGSSSLKDYYGLSENFETNSSNGWIVQLQNVDPVNDHIYDPYGIPMSGTVYGVQKYMGPWRGHDLFKTPVTLTQSDCQFNLQWFIDYVNLYFNWPAGLPALECAASQGYEYFGNPEQISNSTQYYFCYDHLETFEFGKDGNLFDLMTLIEECEELVPFPPGSGSVGGFHWPGNLDYLIFSQIDKPGLSVELTEADLFDADGNFIPVSFTTNPGLYRLNLVFNDKSILPLHFDIKQPVTNALNLSDLLGVTVFPVPLTQNTFTLRLSSPVNMAFTYTLHGPDASVLYRSRFELTADNEKDFFIDPRRDIPAGLISHRFTFADGSVLSVPTLRTQN
jgi:hypothetical protein